MVDEKYEEIVIIRRQKIVYMKKEWQTQQKKITNISLQLRKKYYSESITECCYFELPHGITGNMSESIGAWPEFIFRGTFCRRTFNGYCSPCFYSQFPIDKKEKGIDYIKMIRCQFDYVINNFEELVIKRQYGIQREEKNDFITFVLTPTGSYFDNEEFPQFLRIEMLEKLVEKANQYERNIQLLIECHCKDWNKLDLFLDSTKKEIQLLKELNAMVLFGFESSNDYVRNVLYNKNLEMEEFEKACTKAQNIGLEIGIFIFAGLFSMNDLLTIEDVSSSIRFALNKKISPVLMFQNVQQYTINDVLFKADKIKLIEPFTVLEIILCLINEIEKNDIVCKGWLIADPKGGPPVPEFNIFDCAHITSKENADKIYDMIHNLRLTRDFVKFKAEAQKLKATKNYCEYQNMLKTCFKAEELLKNTDRLLECVENIINEER